MLPDGIGYADAPRDLINNRASRTRRKFSQENDRKSGGALVFNYLTSRNLPVSTSKMQPRTATSLAIQGCDLTFLICSRVFCSGSL